MHKRCPVCKQTKKLDEFAINRSRGDGRQGRCRICKANYDRARYANADTNLKLQITAWRRNRKKEVHTWIYAYLTEHPCVDCGEPDPVVLQFDHVRGEKFAEVGIGIQQQWSDARLRREVEKCEVRCANCHTRKTARDGNWYKHLMGRKQKQTMHLALNEDKVSASLTRPTKHRYLIGT